MTNVPCRGRTEHSEEPGHVNERDQFDRDESDGRVSREEEINEEDRD